MKTKFTWVGILATLLVVITTFFVACKKDDMNEVVKYHGQVVYINTTTPFANLTVKVTNGSDTHCQTETDGGGMFSLTVRVSEIDGNYYLLAGDETCIPKKVALGGYGQSEVDLGVIEVEGPSIPVVETKPISNISAEGAYCGGNVITDGRMDVTARGVCWAKTEYPTLDNDFTTNGTGKGEFQSKITNLERGTTYYVRAYATNASGTAYGEQVTFSTFTGLPTIITAEVSDIKLESAICGGNVTDNGGFSIIARGVCWSSTSSTPTISDNHTSEVPDNGSFTSQLLGLSPNTTYYVRAYATNSIGTNYGEKISFTTNNGLPVVSTIFSMEMTSTSITIGGNVTYDGEEDVSAYGIVYGKFPNPTVSDSKVVVGQGMGMFSTTIDVPSLSTENHYFRAFATNVNGTTYGEQIEITPEVYKYTLLKTMTFQGYTYKIKKMGKDTWQNAYDACENLVYAGFSDWYMPSTEEVERILRTYGLWGANYGTSVNEAYFEGLNTIWALDQQYEYVFAYIETIYYTSSPGGRFTWGFKYIGGNSSTYCGYIAVRKYVAN